MSTPRLRVRAPSVRFVAVGWLNRHRLKFHKEGYDHSGKCDAEFTNNESDVIYGVVYDVTEAEKKRLDKFEDLGNAYDEKIVSVFIQENKTVETVTYYAISTDCPLEPYDWYKEHVLRGALEHGLPEEYIATIKAINSKPDPDIQRNEKEISIYR